MSPHYLHLLTNHIPVFGCFFGLVFLIIGLLRRNESFLKASLVIIALTTFLTGPAFKTGEGAEEAVEAIPGISHRLVHWHEEAAERAFYLLIPTGLFALGLLVYTRYVALHSRVPYYVLLVLMVAVMGLMGNASRLGGMIRRPELYPKDLPPDRKRNPEQKSDSTQPAQQPTSEAATAPVAVRLFA
jgi:uncharacterized membrane protein